MTPIFLSQPTIIPSPIKETTYLQFQPEDTWNPKAGASAHFFLPLLPLPLLGLWLLAKHPLITFLKEIPQRASSLSTLSLVCFCTTHLFSHLILQSSFSLISSINLLLRQSYLSISNPFFSRSGLCRWVFVGLGNICLRPKPPVQFDSNHTAL